MRNLLNKSDPAGAVSFLPEDYIERKNERRANLIYLTLFAIVILGVVGAFFVNNRQWSSVKDQQEAINVRYAQAAKDIELLKELEQQKNQMLAKAELTTALIEHVPRSVLLAEFINRMPERLTLLEVELESKAVKPARAVRPPANGATSLATQAGQSDTPATPEPPRFDTRVTVVGVAATHSQVAWYVSSLQDCELLDRVDLKFSENTIIRDRGLNKFRIELTLKSNADARRIELLTAPTADAFEFNKGDSSLLGDASEKENEGSNQ